MMLDELELGTLIVVEGETTGPDRDDDVGSYFCFEGPFAGVTDGIITVGSHRARLDTLYRWSLLADEAPVSTDAAFMAAMAVHLDAPVDERAEARADLRELIEIFMANGAPVATVRRMRKRIADLSSPTT